LSGRALSEAAAIARLSIAKEAISAGENLTQFADRIGVTVAGAHNWLKRNGRDELANLSIGGHGRPAHEALVWLLLLRVAMEFPGGQAKLARALGITHQNLYAFTTKWASDGVDRAIADLWPDDAPPEFLPTKKNPGRKGRGKGGLDCRGTLEQSGQLRDSDPKHGAE